MRRACAHPERDRARMEGSGCRWRQRSEPVRLAWSLRDNPILRQWVDFSVPGTARVFTAKVELGQGILTALAQIAADELRLPIERIAVVSGDTRHSPNESYTAGSMSIEIGGSS